MFTRMLIALCSLASLVGAQTSEPNSLVDRGDLHRLAKVFARGEAGKPIKIAALGGSITQGYAASKPENRYANRVADWFRKTYPDSDVSLLNAGVGATGSEYGCLRVQRDVLANVPDLVILEFSVNDSNNEAYARSYEGVVRQILTATNGPALLLLFMTQEDGTSAQQWDEKIGRHYAVPMISYHDAIFDQLRADKLTWKVISPDNIHPNDKGMEYAARYITDFLASIKSEKPAGSLPELPKPLLTDLFAHTELAEGEGLAPTTQQGWTQDRENHYWSATQPGSTFEAEMQGEDISLMYYKIHKDFGRARVTVDDAPPILVDGWFDQTWGGKRETTQIAHDLKSKTHKIKIELLDEKSDASNGHEFRILGLGSAGNVDAETPTTGAYRWRNAPMIGGGFVSGIVTHPTEKGLMYARTDIGGAYRRSVSEKDWTPITDWIDQAHWNYTGIESVAIDPSDASRVYIAAGSYTNTWGGNGAILRSADQGKTWQVTPMSFKMGGNEDGRGMGERLSVDPHDGKLLMFGSRKNGLWRSEDRGATWKQVDSFPDQGDTKGVGICFTYFDSKSSIDGAKKTILAGTGNPDHCLYRSDDGGQSWQALDNAPKGLIPHHVAQDADGTILLTFGNGPGPNNVTAGAFYKLTLADNSFTDISPAKPNDQDKFGYAGVTVDPQHPGTIMVSTLDRWAKSDEVFRTTNAGKSWVGLRDKQQRDVGQAQWLKFGKSSIGIGHWISDVEVDPFDTNHLLYVTGWGMWETFDLNAADQNKATHWKVAAKGIEEVVTNDLISPPDGAHLLSVMWDIDGFRHNDPHGTGTNFQPNYGGNTSIDFAEAKPSRIVRVYGAQPVGGSSGSGNGGSISDDDGQTWTAFVSRPNENCKSGTVAIDANGTTIVWTPDAQPTIVTHDRGAAWQPCKGLPDKSRVISDRENSKVFYALDSESGSVLVSEDNGDSFALRSKDLPKGENYLASVPSKNGELWLATEKGLFVSLDSARTFKSIGEFAAVKRVGFGRARHDDATHPAVYAVGTRAGVYGFYRSDDRGQSWLRINDDDHQFGEITAIIGDPRNFGRVYVASRNRGVLVGEPK